MNNKLVLFLLLIFLILLLLFYYLKIQSNIIVLLYVVIILLLNEMIVNKQHFVDGGNNGNENLQGLLNKIDNTLGNLEQLKHSSEKIKEELEIPFLQVDSSCAPNYNTIEDESVEDLSNNPLQNKSLGNYKVPNLVNESESDGVHVSIDTMDALTGITE